MRYWTMDEIRRANENAGLHFFDAGALRFFRSRIGKTVYQGPGGVYFVTSEQYVSHTGSAPRRYSVRRFSPETGTCETVGEFNVLTRAVAVRRASDLAAGKGV